jgi:hypothetical protein
VHQESERGCIITNQLELIGKLVLVQLVELFEVNFKLVVQLDEEWLEEVDGGEIRNQVFVGEQQWLKSSFPISLSPSVCSDSFTEWLYVSMNIFFIMCRLNVKWFMWNGIL